MRPVLEVEPLFDLRVVPVVRPGLRCGSWKLAWSSAIDLQRRPRRYDGAPLRRRTDAATNEGTLRVAPVVTTGLHCSPISCGNWRARGCAASSPSLRRGSIAAGPRRSRWPGPASLRPRDQSGAPSRAGVHRLRDLDCPRLRRAPTCLLGRAVRLWQPSSPPSSGTGGAFSQGTE